MKPSGTTLNAAVIGVGNIGRLHAQVYSEHWQTVLTGVMDIDPIRARTVGEELGVPWFIDTDKLLSQVEIDVVSVATPENMRLTPALACARAGKALLLEKPLAATLQEADHLVAAISATGAFASVNYLLRADPRFLAARAAIVSGQIGDVCAFTARRRGTSAAARKYEAFTDLLASTAIHDLDAMLWLGGSDVSTVYAEASSRSGGRTEDFVASVLRFENGSVGMLETSWVLPTSQPAPIDVSFHVLGTLGAILIDGADHGFQLLNENRLERPDLTHWPVGPLGVGGALRTSIDLFLRAVSRSAEAPVPLAEARQSEALASALTASLHRKQPVIPSHRP